VYQRLYICGFPHATNFGHWPIGHYVRILPVHLRPALTTQKLRRKRAFKEIPKAYSFVSPAPRRAAHRGRLPYNLPYGRTQPTDMWAGYMSSEYNSMQVAFRRLFSKGLMIQGA
jgi:hypothetical protein